MRTWTLVLIVAGTSIYQIGRLVIGLPLTFDTFLSTVWFSGSALLIHWQICRNIRSF